MDPMVIIFLGLITGRLATPCNKILCAVLDKLHILLLSTKMNIRKISSKLQKAHQLHKLFLIKTIQCKIIMNYYSIYKSSEFKTIHLRKLSDQLNAFSNIQKKTGIVSYYGSSGAK